MPIILKHHMKKLNILKQFQEIDDQIAVIYYVLGDAIH